MMRIAICEDDSNMQKRLEEAIIDWAEARKINVDTLCYPSAEAFLIAWPEISFDLAFLDIQMKQMTGIDLAEYIRKTDEHMLVVFVTSFSQYVLKGFDVNALHYLIKPISPAKLLPVLDKAQTIFKSRQDSFFIVSNGMGQMKLPYGDIVYISMSAHTANIHTDKDVFEIRKTADEIAEMLPSYFVRCHRSYIVNLFRVECVYKDSALLSNGDRITVSRNNSKQFSDAFIRLHISR